MQSKDALDLPLDSPEDLVPLLYSKRAKSLFPAGLFGVWLPI